MDVLPQHLRPERERGAEDDQQELETEVRSAREDSQAGRELETERGRPGDEREHGQATGSRSPRRCEGPPDDAEIPRSEERGERRRGDEREARGPAHREARELVEGMASEGGRAAFLGEERHALGVARRGGQHDEAGDQHRERSEAAGVDGDDPEREEDPRAHPRIRRRGEARAAVRRPGRRRPAAHHGRALRARGEPGRGERCHPLQGRTERLTATSRSRVAACRSHHERITAASRSRLPASGPEQGSHGGRGHLSITLPDDARAVGRRLPPRGEPLPVVDLLRRVDGVPR